MTSFLTERNARCVYMKSPSDKLALQRVWVDELIVVIIPVMSFLLLKAEITRGNFTTTHFHANVHDPNFESSYFSQMKTANS